MLKPVENTRDTAGEMRMGNMTGDVWSHHVIGNNQGTAAPRLIKRSSFELEGRIWDEVLFSGGY